LAENLFFCLIPNPPLLTPLWQPPRGSQPFSVQMCRVAALYHHLGAGQQCLIITLVGWQQRCYFNTFFLGRWHANFGVELWLLACLVTVASGRVPRVGLLLCYIATSRCPRVQALVRLERVSPSPACFVSELVRFLQPLSFFLFSAAFLRMRGCFVL